jgi:hypothetical protein
MGSKQNLEGGHEDAGILIRTRGRQHDMLRALFNVQPEQIEA